MFASVSGWGSDGPYENLGSHGLAFDAFAGLAPPRQVDGRPARPVGHVWTGLEAGPLYAALAIVSGVLRARLTGEPSSIEVSEADAAAIWNGWRIAYDAAVARYGDDPDDPDQRELVEALSVAAEGAGRSDDLTATDVRYQYYAASDGHVLFMATEQKFWRNFCRAIDRYDLFERWPGSGYADHDYGNVELRRSARGGVPYSGHGPSGSRSSSITMSPGRPSTPQARPTPTPISRPGVSGSILTTTASDCMDRLSG